MPAADNSSGNFLFDLAAESVGPLVGGCAGVLLAGPLGAVAGVVLGTAVEKGINYFGRRIISAWWQKLGALPPGRQQRAVEQLAAIPQADALKLATRLVERAAPQASPEDRKAAAAYLASIPAAARRTLAVDHATGRPTCPGNLLAGEQSLPQLLPVDLPPFLPPCSLPGTPYQLEELVGSGGFGVVYRAKNSSVQLMDFAVKFCLDPRMRQSLVNERDNLTRLLDRSRGRGWSDHVVRLCGLDLDYAVPYLVYEYVGGGDLTGYLAGWRQQTGKGMPPDRAFGVVVQVAEGLAFAHRHGLVHRDLKPANVLVRKNARGKLEVLVADFGIGGVVAAQALGGRVGTSSANLLTAHEQADLFRGSGTMLYMCREQQRGDAPDPRFDVYSLGVIWYQLLTGDVTQGLHPAWAEELKDEYKTPAQHIDWIRQCVGLMKGRPADGQALLALLRETPRPPAPARPDPAAAERAREAEFEKLQRTLAVQMARNAWLEAETTAHAMLRLKPNDPETKASLAHVRGRWAVDAVPIVQPVADVKPVAEPPRRRRRRDDRPPDEPRPAGVGASVRVPGVLMALLGLAGLLGNLYAVFKFSGSTDHDVVPYFAGFTAAGLVAAVAGLRLALGRGFWLGLLGCLAVAVTTHVFAVGVGVGLWSLIALLVVGPKRFSTTAGGRRAPDGQNGGGCGAVASALLIVLVILVVLTVFGAGVVWLLMAGA